MKRKPEYLSIYEQLRGEIAAGSYPYGTRLPSKRDLAARCGVSVITVEHACALLAEEGYIQPRQRSGCFIIYREGDSFSPAPASALPAPHRSAGPEDSFPFTVYARTMRRVLTEYGEGVLQRSDNTGCAELRQALSRYLLRSRHMEAPPEQIIIGAGAEYLYGLILRLLGRDRIYAIEDPSYAKIEQVYRADGVDVRLLPLDRDGLQSAALADTDAGVLHISPYRSFPSGVTASASKKREYLHWAAERSGIVIEDDFESEFTPSSKPEDTVFSLDRQGRVIYLNTFSRTIAPAVRVGYMVLPEALMARFRENLGFYACTVPTLSQYVLAELLDSGEFERHLNRIRRKKRKRQGSRDDL